MNLATILSSGGRTLLRHKLRSALTVLGITIGTGAVICVVAIGQAGSVQIQEQLLNLGDNLVWIEEGGRAVNGIRTGTHSTRTLIPADAVAIQQQIPLLKSCSPQVDAPVPVVYGNQNWTTTYRSGTPEYFDIRRWSVDRGGPFTTEDVDKAAEVAVIGSTVKERLFGDQDPLGKVIRVKDRPFKVIGVLHPKGVSTFGQDQDDTLIMPYTTAQKKIKGITWVDDIFCSAVTSEASRDAAAQAAVLLRERHHLRAEQDDDFNIRNPEEIIQAQLEASKTFTLFLTSIGAVSLLVGGIGIMNVMLVSVTERTREIGVRMAVGATEGEVRMQFLGEAVMLSLAGGAIGVLLGVGGSFGLGRALKWPMQVSLEAVAIAALLSITVGVFFGYYPAKKASMLDPIQALRYE